MKIYDDCGGINWKGKNNWGSTADVCEWERIECKSNGIITTLNLTDAGLTG